MRQKCARKSESPASSTGASCPEGGDARSWRRAGTRPAASETAAPRPQQEPEGCPAKVPRSRGSGSARQAVPETTPGPDSPRGPTRARVSLALRRSLAEPIGWRISPARRTRHEWSLIAGPNRTAFKPSAAARGAASCHLVRTGLSPFGLLSAALPCRGPNHEPSVLPARLRRRRRDAGVLGARSLGPAPGANPVRTCRLARSAERALFRFRVTADARAR